MSGAHSPYDWTTLCDDPDCDCQWLKYGRSATKAGTLRCRVCGQKWPCETKRSHHQKEAKPCESCHGTGRVRWQYPNLHAITCPWCYGTGAK